MRRTGPGILLIAAAIGIAAGFLLDQVLTAGGRATFNPTITLPIFLVLLGAMAVALALPIRRATKPPQTGRTQTRSTQTRPIRAGGSSAPVNPFWALRIAVLAKASSIVGAAAGGFGGGLAIFLLSRPVSPSVGSLGPIIATVGCGAALVAAGLYAEYLCTIRKDDDDEQPGAVA